MVAPPVRYFRLPPSPAVLLAAVFIAGLLGCDKAPTRRAPEKNGSAPTEVPAPEPQTKKPPPSEQGVDEPTTDPQPAQEDVPPPKFGKGASSEFRGAFSRLSNWVTAQGGRVHAALVDLDTDEWLLRASADTPINPASNAKVLTAAAALELLGPAYHFETRLLGRIDPKGSCSRLVLEGGGAPDLTTADLWRLVRVAKGRGLSEVGDVVVDQSRFTARFVPPAFEQQPKEWAPFRAPISALALDENAVTLNVVSTAAGQAARVWYDPPGVVVSQGRVETGKSGSGDRVRWNLDPKADPQRPESTVGGTLAEGLGRRRYSRRLEDPRLAGGLALSELLEDAGIEVTGKVTLGTSKGEPRLALWYSQPLAEIVRALGKDSNNFVAEMLLVALSQADDAPDDEPWSSERGARAVLVWLEDKKIDAEGIVVKNGSGLFDANRVSAEVFTKVLASIEDNPRIFQDFVSHLAMGSTDGTMKKRLRGSELGKRVRAKTGTLRNVDALSGYVQRPGGKSPAAFSVIVVDTKASHGEVRRRVDELILSWTKAL